MPTRKKKINYGSAFEKLIQRTFSGYVELKIARLEMMPVPMFPCGLHPKFQSVVYRPSGKAPFDIYGYGLLGAGGQFIGVELKSSQRKPSLPLVPPPKPNPDKKGKTLLTSNGIQWHQLNALAHVAQAGGTARIVWENGGEIGVIRNAEIIQAWQVLAEALKSEGAGREAPRGVKSIRWENFILPAKLTLTSGGFIEDWLML